MRSLASLIVAALALMSFGSTAYATGSTAVPLPEPGVVGIFAVAAGLVAAARFIRRK